MVPFLIAKKHIYLGSLFIANLVSLQFGNIDYVKQGMNFFRSGDISASLISFDAAILKEPKMKYYSWQRGISLYFLDRYQDCSEQFKTDVSRNPQDTEEVIWNAACLAKGDRSHYASTHILELPNADPRPIMKEIYNLFKGKIRPEDLISWTNDHNLNPSDYFYSRLYLSLYYDSIANDAKQSEYYINEALQSNYALYSNDYMISVGQEQLRALTRKHDQ